MFSRRDFLTSSSLLCGGSFGRPALIFANPPKPTGYFGVHPFIERHPEAVFILRTHVDSKTNFTACKRVGLEFGHSVLVPMDETGVPVTHNIATKPNLTAHDAVDTKRGFTLEDTMGIATDVFFVEGLFESLKELGVSGRKMHTRDANGADVIKPRGYVAMAQRIGATVTPSRDRIATPEDANEPEAFVWKEVPGGVVSTQLPYLWPFNARDSWNLNVAKFKAHEMGMTLTAKNWQGSHPTPFQRYCGQWADIDALQKLEAQIRKKYIHPGVHDIVNASFKRHTHAIPRWNTPDVLRDDPAYNEAYWYNAICMELWAHRTIDNLAASPMGLHVVEGIYGRDGDFNYGPNPLGNENNYNGRAWDYMTNIVIFGKNSYLVDLVGHWLGGHEPGNFGLFHIASERGKLDVINPMKVPIYEWQDGIAVRRPLTSFTRTPLRSFYLHQRAKEPLWHLCDEPFDYAKVGESKLSVLPKPVMHVLNEHYPTANNPHLAIEFSVPETAWVLVEILDRNDNNLEVISNTICEPGYHMAAWNTAKYGSGQYKCRLRYQGYQDVQDLVLNKA